MESTTVLYKGEQILKNNNKMEFNSLILLLNEKLSADEASKICLYYQDSEGDKISIRNQQDLDLSYESNQELRIIIESLSQVPVEKDQKQEIIQIDESESKPEIIQTNLKNDIEQDQSSGTSSSDSDDSQDEDESNSIDIQSIVSQEIMKRIPEIVKQVLEKLAQSEQKQESNIKQEKIENLQSTKNVILNNENLDSVKEISGIIASVVGGEACNYFEIVSACQGLSIEEIIQAVLVSKNDKTSDIKSMSTPHQESTPQQEQSSIKNQVSEAQIASIFGGQAEDFSELIKNCSGLSLEQIVDAVLAGNELKPTIQKEESRKMEVDCEQIEPQVENKKFERKHQNYEWHIEKKANDIQEVIGGDIENYIQIVKNNPNLSSQELIENLLYSDANLQSDLPKNYSTSKSQSVQINLTQAKQNYSVMTKEKAARLAEILGGKDEDYYEICDKNCYKSVAQILQMIFDGNITV